MFNVDLFLIFVSDVFFHDENTLVESCICSFSCSEHFICVFQEEFRYDVERAVHTKGDFVLFVETRAEELVLDHLWEFT